jgi:hypothetical protein
MEEELIIDNEYEIDISSNNGICEDYEEVDTEASISSKKKTIQVIDKGYHFIYKVINGKKYKFEFYSTSNIIGSYVRNAITGIRYNVKVGSAESGQFFRVNDSTHIKMPSDRTFYYENPEQCERHLNIEILPLTKQKWYNKYYLNQNTKV